MTAHAAADLPDDRLLVGGQAALTVDERVIAGPFRFGLALDGVGISPAEIESLAHTLRWTWLVHPSMNRRALLHTTRLAAFLDDALDGRG